MEQSEDLGGTTPQIALRNCSIDTNFKKITDNKNSSWRKYFEIMFNRELLKELALVSRRKEDFVSN